MSTFHARMQECKRARADMRRRGVEYGDFRGTVRPRDDWRGLEGLELDIAALLHRTFTDVWNGFRHELEFIVADMNGLYADEIPF